MQRKQASRKPTTNATATTATSATTNERAERLDVQNIDMVYEMLKPLSPQRVRNIIKEEGSLLKIEAVEVLPGVKVNIIRPESVQAYIEARANGTVTTRNGMSNVVAMVVWVPLDREATEASETGEKIPTKEAIAWLDASEYKYKPRDKARKANEQGDDTNDDDDDDDNE